MKVKEEIKKIAKKNLSDLNKDSILTMKEICRYRMDLEAKKEENYSKLKVLRKKLARINTLINQKSKDDQGK